MDELWKTTVGLDLKMVRQKFAARKSWWWHLGHDPARIESEYRQFLFLMAGNPQKTLVPWSQDLDDFWREHLLDARKYAADCDVLAGRLLEHNPYLRDGLRRRVGEFAQTRKLYLEAFGESARKRRHTAQQSWPGDDATVVFSDSGSIAPYSHHSHHGVSHGWGHGGAYGAGHSAAGHGGGGHGGHGCGGHSGCGGHGH